jgi:CcmD family protein
MNGMVVNSWPYVIAAFAVTWVVLIGYSIRLARLARITRALSARAVPGAKS